MVLLLPSCLFFNFSSLFHDIPQTQLLLASGAPGALLVRGSAGSAAGMRAWDFCSGAKPGAEEELFPSGRAKPLASRASACWDSVRLLPAPPRTCEGTGVGPGSSGAASQRQLRCQGPSPGAVRGLALQSVLTSLPTLQSLNEATSFKPALVQRMGKGVSVLQTELCLWRWTRPGAHEFPELPLGMCSKESA